MALITELDDRTLVEQHRDGDPEAFRTIVLRHRRNLYANAMRRLGDPVAADDAVQEALLRAFLAIDRFDGDYHLDAWLHRILTNVCHDMGRRRGRDTRLVDKASGAVEVTAPPADDDLESMPRAQLEEALASLPDTYREVLLLRFVDELDYGDVAQVAGISEENARARVSRGRSMLRKMLDGAAAAVVWLIPPLRRNHLYGSEASVAEAATQAHGVAQVGTAATQLAPTVATSAPAVSQASTFLANAAPALAQAAPAVQSSAPALGKAAVAVGIAASVAIPAGVAVEKRIDRPAPAAAPAPEETATAPAPADPVEVDAAPTTTPESFASGVDVDGVGPASGTDAVGAELDEGADGTTTDDGTPGDGADGSTGTTEPTSSTTTAPAPSTTVAPAEPVAEEPAAEEPAPAPAAPEGYLDADVAVADAGPRLELSGRFLVDVDGRTVTGSLEGKLLVGEPTDKDGTGPRSLDGDLVLTLDDGRTATLRVRGEVTVDAQGQRTIRTLSAAYRLDGADALGLAASGDLRGELATRDGVGTLSLALPGQPTDDGSGA